MRKWSRWFFPTNTRRASFIGFLRTHLVLHSALQGNLGIEQLGSTRIEHDWTLEEPISEWRLPVIFRRSVTLVFGHANKLPGCYMLAGRQIDLTVDDQPETKIEISSTCSTRSLGPKKSKPGVFLYMFWQNGKGYYTSKVPNIQAFTEKTTVGRGCKRDEKNWICLQFFKGF